MPILLLNGPPYVGKDTLGTHLGMELNRPVRIFKLAGLLKRQCHLAFGQDKPHDAYELVKDEPNPDFYGISPREAYIAFSEKFYKPLFGKEIFGRLMVREVNEFFMAHPDGLAVVTDSGFLDEARPLVDGFGLSNCILGRIYGRGRGKTFDGDSRSYWDNAELGLRRLDFYNEKERDTTWLFEAQAMIEAWLASVTPYRVLELRLPNHAFFDMKALAIPPGLPEGRYAVGKGGELYHDGPVAPEDRGGIHPSITHYVDEGNVVLPIPPAHR